MMIDIIKDFTGCFILKIIWSDLDLISLGYLAYDSFTKSVFISNQEVYEEFKRSTENNEK